MIKLIMIRYGRMYESLFNNIKKAAESACMDIETGEAAPYEIWEDDERIWWIKSPIADSYRELRTLAGDDYEI